LLLFSFSFVLWLFRVALSGGRLLLTCSKNNKNSVCPKASEIVFSFAPEGQTERQRFFIY
ncbi:MAG TPA: hypothetical protein VHA52_11300, partial [Candidatus Babeliaceae bacterium]|nr:hypothetical protein [Candidatus Babeliaceae bacterium]